MRGTIHHRIIKYTRSSYDSTYIYLSGATHTYYTYYPHSLLWLRPLLWSLRHGLDCIMHTTVVYPHSVIILYCKYTSVSKGISAFVVGLTARTYYIYYCVYQSYQTSHGNNITTVVRWWQSVRFGLPLSAFGLVQQAEYFVDPFYSIFASHFIFFARFFLQLDSCVPGIFFFYNRYEYHKLVVKCTIHPSCGDYYYNTVFPRWKMHHPPIWRLL